MQVHGQRVHRDDLAAFRAGESRERRGEALVEAEPAVVRGLPSAIRKVAVHAEPRPTVELGRQAATGGARHQAERMAAQIDRRAAARCSSRQLELAAEAGKLVVGVEGPRAGCARLERARRWHQVFGAGMTVPQRLQVRESALA